MISGSITKDGLSKSEVDPYGVCSCGVKANTVFCLQCGRWVHGRCAVVKWVTANVSKNIACRTFAWNIGKAAEQVEKWIQLGNIHSLVTG